MNQDTREKYGFLYNGFRQEAYYWESIIMYRKVVMIFISVFLKAIGTKFQALIVFIVVLGFLLLNAEKRPFLTRELNNLEQISLIASSLTIYCGFFFLSSMNSESIMFSDERDCNQFTFFTIISLIKRGIKMVFLLLNNILELNIHCTLAQGVFQLNQREDTIKVSQFLHMLLLEM